MSEIYKTCIKCQKTVPATKDFFYKNKGCKLGIDTTCKECMKQRSKKWEQDNQERKRVRQNEYRKKRRDTDKSFKITELLRKRTWDALNGNSKSGTTIEMLSCPIQQFLDHLESQFTPKMSWSNQGVYWHIDHIIPCSRFDLSKQTEQKKCFNYRNLRPLKADQNKAKGDLVDMDLIAKYDILDLLPIS